MAKYYTSAAGTSVIMSDFPGINAVMYVSTEHAHTVSLHSNLTF